MIGSRISSSRGAVESPASQASAGGAARLTANARAGPNRSARPKPAMAARTRPTRIASRRRSVVNAVQVLAPARGDEGRRARRRQHCRHSDMPGAPRNPAAVPTGHFGSASASIASRQARAPAGFARRAIASPSAPGRPGSVSPRKKVGVPLIPAFCPPGGRGGLDRAGPAVQALLELRDVSPSPGRGRPGPGPRARSPPREPVVHSQNFPWPPAQPVASAALTACLCRAARPASCGRRSGPCPSRCTPGPAPGSVSRWWRAQYGHW